MTVPTRRASGLILAPVMAALLLACAGNPDKKNPAERPENPFKFGGALDSGAKPGVSSAALKLEADQLYRRAREVLESGDYTEAVSRYQQLAERYPFTEFATQADLEKVYALYKTFQPDEALSAADRFLREHPRHPRADYVQYLKGIINSERDVTLVDNIPGVDPSKGDMSSPRRAFDDFGALIQRYPNSQYAQDGRARMVALRNKMADHEMHVVNYYLKRRAFLSAAKRAEDLLALYPGAPATFDALKAMEQSYRELGLEQQANDARTLRIDLVSTPAAVSAAGQPALMEVVATPVTTPAADATPGILQRIADWFSFGD